MYLFSLTRPSADEPLWAVPLDLPAGTLLLPFEPWDPEPGPLLALPLPTGDVLEKEFSPPDNRDPGLNLPAEALVFPLPFLCFPGLLKGLIVKEC